ncbi:MAG TPA: rod shape-determining protein MreD [Thermomicrobiales bacterium]|nr:rod shape-determining protein MreD [Thermomicrobiales bacterium]
MTRPLFGIVLVIAALLQATLLPAIGPVIVLPDLVLVLILVRSATRGLVEALAWTAVAGLLLDVLAMDRIGVNGLALLPVALMGVVAQRRVFQSGLLFPMLLAMAATVVQMTLLAILRGADGQGLAPLPELARLVILQALLNALLVPPLYGLLHWLGRMEPERS